jgi:hypothetical protein
MANLDANQWYRIQNKEISGSLAGTVLYANGGNTGSAFFQGDDDTNSKQWQFFPYDSSYYIIRCRNAGPEGYLNVALQANMTGTIDSNLVPDLRSYTWSDESALWQIEPDGDGFFYLSNAANGTNWRMSVLGSQAGSNSAGWMAMDSNITGTQDGQSYIFPTSGFDAVDDETWSTINASFVKPLPFLSLKLISLDASLLRINILALYLKSNSCRKYLPLLFCPETYNSRLLPPSN